MPTSPTARSTGLNITSFATNAQWQGDALALTVRGEPPRISWMLWPRFSSTPGQWPKPAFPTLLTWRSTTMRSVCSRCIQPGQVFIKLIS
jgi:hypothetical protein